MAGLLRSANFLSNSLKTLRCRSLPTCKTDASFLEKYVPLLDTVRHAGFFNKRKLIFFN